MSENKNQTIRCHLMYTECKRDLIIVDLLPLVFNLKLTNALLSNICNLFTLIFLKENNAQEKQ